MVKKLDKKLVSAYKLQIGKILKYAKVAPKDGLTEGELRQYLGDLAMKSFGKWIDGQTCMVTDDRQIIVYPEDIDRFARNIRFPGADLWD